MLLSYLQHMPVASIIFVLTLATSIYTFSHEQLFGKLMLHPYSIARKRNVHTILTSGFVHKDWGHLLFNMLTFYYFAFGLERILAEVSPYGHILFAVIYVGSLILSDIPTIIQQKNNPGYYSLGASGAICAVLFSYILFDPKVTIGVMMIIPMPAYLFAFLFLGYCIWASKKGQDGINHDAHFFGALSGLILTIICFPWVIKHCLAQF
ncbi:rhomboid family intramembrane serine protease [Sphingobacterium sp.]|uniref:rhomboid family intramembrane serine protease n=1 Tax=Sphingobacterium sp. TaxID=341027 RepID=UPI002FDD5DA8